MSDFDREYKTNADQPSDYQGYGSESQTRDSMVARSIERDMTLEEYKEDRDFILITIKNALKEKNYEEAQTFVHKYRAAAKIDENFAVLARMTAQGLEGEKKIEKFVTMLDVTPENDYPARRTICKKILAVQPDNETYKAELERCENAMGLASPNSLQQTPQESQPAQHSPSYITASILCILNALMYIGSMDNVDGVNKFLMFLAYAAGSIASFFLLTNKRSPMSKWNRVAKITVNVAIWFVYVGIIFSLWPNA